MKKLSSMRPHDILILLKIATKGEKPWLMKDLAQELKISAGEVSESLNRSAYAGLISGNKKKLMTSALLEFLQYGLKYVFPQNPSAVTRGVPTAWSALPLSDHIESSEVIVWPYSKGKMRGQSIDPLYSSVPEVCMKDPSLHELLALTDALRIGKARERTIALDELTKKLR